MRKSLIIHLQQRFFNTATQNSSFSLSQTESLPRWLMPEIRARKEGRPALPVTYRKKSHVSGLLLAVRGRAEAHINHNKDAYWSSVRSTRVMMSERTEGAGRWIFWMDFLHVYRYRSVYMYTYMYYTKIRKLNYEFLLDFLSYKGIKDKGAELIPIPIPSLPANTFSVEKKKKKKETLFLAEGCHSKLKQTQSRRITNQKK